METWWRGINKLDLINAFLRDMVKVFVIQTQNNTIFIILDNNYAIIL